MFRNLELKSARERILREVATKHDFTIYDLEVNTDMFTFLLALNPIY
ncbi:MAG: hypothetical protein DRO76_05945, partial [Candidatus Altiarchaeales archaeon]